MMMIREDFFSRLDSIYMDITRNVFQRLDQDKIPAVLLSSLSSGKSSFDIYPLDIG